MECSSCFVLSRIILVVFSVSFAGAVECPENLRLLCHDQKNCGDCMMAHSCCNWCYETNFDGYFRCDFGDALAECKGNLEINKKLVWSAEKNEAFTVIKNAEDAPNAIQIQPQVFSVTLRKDEPLNLTFTYKAAKNYPLELYYLGDLSYSMRTHLETLKNLGDDLGKSLEKLTKHYKLAYGSFLDKPGMPYIWIDQQSIENPCRADNVKCEKTYLFKHSLDFTDDMSQFFEQVRNSKISANVDDLDGALEAIFQILVCNKQFGWSDYSRKIILLSTDSFLHTEGDGLLAGATTVNVKNICMVNSTGDHTAPLKYDYPSLGQIKKLLEQYKANLIIAVTEDKLKHYKRMEKDILEKEAFVGVLRNNSKNILELVKEGFNDFIQQVAFSANTSHAPELDLKFYGNCEGFGFNETSSCRNVQEENPMQFKLEITLKDTRKRSEQITIIEKNINENIEIHLNYAAGNCECVNLPTTSDIQCVHGTQDCGTCACDLGWRGDTCSEECKEDLRACRKDDDLFTCSERGNCICGNCACSTPYTGQFCEFACPTDNHGKICSGRGTCFEGVCSCSKGYSGNECDCQDSVEECRLGSDSKICNGQGECACNQCNCTNGYTGKYCEIFAHKNMFCEEYENSVRDNLQNKTENFEVEGKTVLFSQWKDNHLCDTESTCTIIYDSDQLLERCLIDFCYHRGQNNTVHLGIFNKHCSYTAQAGSIGIGLTIFFAIVAGGLIAILIKKVQIYKAERAEFQKFEATKGQGMHEMNPLYKSPIAMYENPMARKK